MVLVFYASAHGFGHASRDIEVIRALVRQAPDARIVLRTGAPTWFFAVPPGTPAEVQALDADTGVVQIDSLRIDEDATARAAARFHETFTARAEAEAAMLRALRADVVVGDVPALAFAAARLAHVPSVMLANFTWDWIYRGLPEFNRLAPGVVDEIVDAYASAALALRLPLHGGFEPVAHVTRDIPLVARRSPLGRETARRRLRVDARQPVVLSSFGRYGVDLPYADIVRDARFTLVVADHTDATIPTSDSRLKMLSDGDLAALGLQYQDLVAAADVVVTKPGYGIVSECIVNGASVLYTTRGRFCEYDMFVRELPAVLRCRPIAQDDLLAGRWENDVEALLRQPTPPARLSFDGADVAAGAILEIADCRFQTAD